MKLTSLFTAALASGACANILPKAGEAGAESDNSQHVITTNWNADSGSDQVGSSLEEKNELEDLLSESRLANLPKTVKNDPATYDFHVYDKEFPNHKLRVKSTPGDLGIDHVKQYSGYLDIDDEDKHFFYWFFESRNDPAKDPIILWLNGGPGCSSMTGLFFELGPSSINAQLKPVSNPYSWNNNASIIFVDQPVNVGFSYSSKSVFAAALAGKDVYALLNLFFKQFPQYQKLDFHIAGESYAGHYIPALASEIISHPNSTINFKSVLIGNGMTDPLTQIGYYRPMACGEGGEPSVLSTEDCDMMEACIPICRRLAETCYKSGSQFACARAAAYCSVAEVDPFEQTGRNRYDMRTTCKSADSCYKEFEYIEGYLNIPDVQKKLGVEVQSYVRFNHTIEAGFFMSGDIMQRFDTHVSALLDAGIPVLIYAGDKDFLCNWLGIQAWTNNVEWSGHKEFAVQPIRNWSVNGTTVGQVKNYKHFTFLRVYDAGHMVPFDQPKNSFEMFTRWIAGDYHF